MVLEVGGLGVNSKGWVVRQAETGLFSSVGVTSMSMARLSTLINGLAVCEVECWLRRSKDFQHLRLRSMDVFWEQVQYFDSTQK